MIMKNFLLPLVYLGNGHYSGQTPPPADNSLTLSETILAVIFIAIIVITIGRKIFKKL